MHPDYAYHRLKTLLKQAELPLIRFHNLRHTFATHALAGGVDKKAALLKLERADMSNFFIPKKGTAL